MTSNIKGNRSKKEQQDNIRSNRIKVHSRRIRIVDVSTADVNVRHDTIQYTIASIEHNYLKRSDQGSPYTLYLLGGVYTRKLGSTFPKFSKGT